MTSSYQQNYIQSLLIGDIIGNPNLNLPPNKQTDIHIAWLSELLKPVNRLNIIKYTDYDLGSTYSLYSPSLTYSIGAKINGGLAYQNAVFEAATSSISGTFSIDKWLKIAPSFVGYEERLKYLDSRVVFEYALNNYFRTTFRQPNFMDTSKSDIYIGDNSSSNQVFLIGPNDFTSGYIGLVNSTLAGPGTSNVFIGPDPSLFPGQNQAFTIYVTATAYSGFPGYTGVSHSADGVIRTYADTINYAGFPYTVETY